MRIFLFLIFFILISRIINIAARLAAGGFPLDKSGWEWWAMRGIIVVIAATIVVWISRRFVDKKSAKSLGLNFDFTALKDFMTGAVLSSLMVAVIFAILYYAGLVEITGINMKHSGFSLVLWLMIWFWGTGLAVGRSEELVFRGYLLQNLKEGIGLVWAVIISCFFYGLVHMSNPNSSILSGILIALLGFVRIFGWLRTGQLWLSMGMHASWNFFQ